MATHLMSDQPKKTGSIFQNARATTPKYADAGVSAGMHNTMTCPNCGAAREKEDTGPLVCRYCGTALVHGGAKP